MVINNNKVLMVWPFKKCKLEYWQNLCSSLQNKTSSRVSWKLVHNKIYSQSWYFENLIQLNSTKTGEQTFR